MPACAMPVAGVCSITNVVAKSIQAVSPPLNPLVQLPQGASASNILSCALRKVLPQGEPRQEAAYNDRT